MWENLLTKVIWLKMIYFNFNKSLLLSLILVQVTHDLLDCICSGKNLRYQSYGKLLTIQEWKVLQENGKEELKGFITRGLNKEEVSIITYRFLISIHVFF